MPNNNEFLFEKVVNHQERNAAENNSVEEAMVEEIYELAHSENSIGEGMTAEVFISKTNPDICYKIIRNDEECKFRHSVYDEGELLAKAEEISRSCGVKIPKPNFSISTKDKNGNEFEVLIMERLHATSIKDILDNELDVPENFDFKIFVSKIENFFAKLHEQNIYHRDAHGGNIMIENGTNTPCIIDFGASIRMPLSSEDPYRQTNSKGELIVFSPDEQKIRQGLRVGLRGYLFKKYGNKHNL